MFGVKKTSLHIAVHLRVIIFLERSVKTFFTLAVQRLFSSSTISNISITINFLGKTMLRETLRTEPNKR